MHDLSLVHDVFLCYECYDYKFWFSEDKFIVAKRKKYLELIRQYRAEGREIYYMDETYANANYVESKMWSDFSISNMWEVIDFERNYSDLNLNSFLNTKLERFLRCNICKNKSQGFINNIYCAFYCCQILKFSLLECWKWIKWILWLIILGH